MTSTHERLLGAVETHDVDKIRALLDAGFDARSSIDGVTVVNHLLEMYFRSDRFPACLALLLDRGGRLDDARLAPVLLNDADALATAVAADPALLRHRTQMRCTFTPLSYAQLGLLPQMHRTEADVYANITELLAAQQRPAPRLGNVPNRYLQ